MGVEGKSGCQKEIMKLEQLTFSGILKVQKKKMEIGKCIASTMMGFHKYHCLSMELLVGGYRGSKV